MELLNAIMRNFEEFAKTDQGDPTSGLFVYGADPAPWVTEKGELKNKTQWGFVATGKRNDIAGNLAAAMATQDDIRIPVFAAIGRLLAYRPEVLEELNHYIEFEHNRYDDTER